MRGRQAVEAVREAVRRLGVCILPICFATLAAVPASADASDSCLADAWIAQATRFVTEQTGSPVPEVCIRFANPEQLAGLVASAAAGRAHGDAVAAVFIPATREILIAHDLDPITPLARSYLVHELVHAQQFATAKHRRISCLGSLEGDAYDTQAHYLRIAGLEQDAFLLQLLGMLQSACEYTY
jgi:hypothetical protein